MNAIDRQNLDAAMKRVQNEISIYGKISFGTPKMNIFIEDLRLILFELWGLLQKKEMNHQHRGRGEGKS
jgi:hypothetical protein